MTTKLSVNSLKPAPGFLIVEPAKTDKQTASGIYLPDSQQDKPQYGTVLAVGDDTVTEGVKIKSPAKTGDLVVYKKWGGNEVKVGTEEWLLIEQKDIMGIVE